MNRKTEPENDDSGPNTDRSVSEMPTEGGAAPSGARRATREGSITGSDTLLSVPTPAVRQGLPAVGQDLDERLAVTERKLEDIQVRITTLEQRPEQATNRATVSWWPWLAFLAALALAWQIVALFR